QNVTVPKSLATAQGATTPPINPPHWQEKEPSERRRAVKLLCDFFGLQKTKKPPADDYCALASENRVTQNETENRGSQNEKVFRVGHLIATIPDPQDSRLDYLFDYYLDAMQHALESMDYVLDHYWLPWKKQQNPQSEPPQVITVQLSQVTPSTQTGH